MKKKTVFLPAIFCLVIGIFGALLIMNGASEHETDRKFTVQVNRLIASLERSWPELQKGDVPAQELVSRIEAAGIEYVLLDNGGEILYRSKDGLSVNVAQATMNFDLIRDVEVSGEVVGKILIHNTWRDGETKRNQKIALLFLGVSVLLSLSMAGYAAWLHRKLIKPFETMEDFAKQVAMGNLDIPLDMDRENAFGAFTQSFDLMREELKKARLREEEAVRSRKELIAQLSHDLKTPVASIKAMAEFMELSAADEEQKMTAGAINAKADQIDGLVSDLFHAALEELEHLEVSMEEVSSEELLRMIREADYRHLVKSAEIPEGVIRMDSLRVSQVIGNVISNSYKYAGTVITVQGFFEKVAEKDFLVLEFSDQGGGVPEEELELILEKFQRGSNSAGKEGAGLGLYISSRLMKKMEGDLSCRNRADGFTVTLRLALA